VSLRLATIYVLLGTGTYGPQFHVEHHVRRLEFGVVVDRAPRRALELCFRRVIDTTVAGSTIVSAPHSTTRMLRAPFDRMASRSRATSSAALAPFIARTTPFGRVNGRHHSANRARGANARPVTTSNFPYCSRTARSSARPRTTATGSSS